MLPNPPRSREVRLVIEDLVTREYLVRNEDISGYSACKGDAACRFR